MNTVTLAQNLRTDNDRNGNPRRLWMFVQLLPEGQQVCYIDEGYYGGRGIISQLPFNVVELPPVNITPTEYRQTRKLARCFNAGDFEALGNFFS